MIAQQSHLFNFSHSAVTFQVLDTLSISTSLVLALVLSLSFLNVKLVVQQVLASKKVGTIVFVNVL